MTINITPVLLSRVEIIRELGDILDNVVAERVGDVPRHARRVLGKEKPKVIKDFWKLYPWQELSNDAALQRHALTDFSGAAREHLEDAIDKLSGRFSAPSLPSIFHTTIF
jgi:hypothetical protein